MLWSSGKGSALALLRARTAGLQVTKLVSLVDPAAGRVRFHATRQRLLEAQAAAAGIELMQVPASWSAMAGALERALVDLCEGGYQAIVMGSVQLADVRDWYRSRIRAAGLEPVEPLWGEPPEALLGAFLEAGGRAVITGVERHRLDPRWLGRELSLDLLAESIDRCGEKGGGYHSFCFQGCGLRDRVGWLAGNRLEDGAFDLLDLVPAGCTGCGAPLPAGSFYVCAVCAGAALCTDCAGDHLCTPECVARGCIAGLCVKEMAGGRLAADFGVTRRSDLKVSGGELPG